MRKLITIPFLCLTLFCWSQDADRDETEQKTVNLLGKCSHVPFAVINGESVSSAGKDSCSAWSESEQVWYNLNKLGEIVGTSKVVSKSYYDITDCYELELKTESGNDGIGFYTSEEVDWAVDSAQFWTPSAEETKSLNAFINTIDALFVDTTVNRYPFEQNETALFFKIRQNDNEDENYFPETKCVVYGKKYLIIAYLNSDNEWKLAHIENDFTNAHSIKKTPISLLDIDDDGIPEILYEDSLGHCFNDKLLKLDNRETIGSWKVKAVSVGGGLM